MRWTILVAVTTGLLSAPALRAESEEPRAASDALRVQTLDGTFEIELSAEGARGPAPPVGAAGGRIGGKWRVTVERPAEAALFLQPVLQLVVVPAADIRVDAQPLGEVSARQIPLDAGTHIVELIHPGFRPLRRTLTLLPGQTLRLVVDLAEEAVRRR